MCILRRYAYLGAALSLLAATAAFASENDAGQVQSAKDLFGARAVAIRKAAADDAGAFSGFLSKSYQADGEAVRRAWTDLYAELGQARLRDFFSGASILEGPVSQRQDKGPKAWAGVLGIYNPWLDAILVMRLDDTLLIDRLAFLGGEAFRGEAVASPESTATIVPSGEPLPMSVMRVQSKTAARFRELYPDDGAADKAKIPPRGLSQDRVAFKRRSELRLGLLKECQADSSEDGKARISKVASAVCRVLRQSDAHVLKRYFADPASAGFCDSFAKFPADVREGLGLYGYVPLEKGSLFVFLNPACPHFFAAVMFPAGRESDPAAGNVAFEWFDLEQAETVLKVADPVPRQ